MTGHRVMEASLAGKGGGVSVDTYSTSSRYMRCMRTSPLMLRKNTAEADIGAPAPWRARYDGRDQAQDCVFYTSQRQSLLKLVREAN